MQLETTMTSYRYNSSRAEAELQATIDRYSSGSYFLSSYSVLCRAAAPLIAALARKHLAHFENASFMQELRTLKGTA